MNEGKGGGSLPRIGRNVYIAPTSYVGGDVSIGEESTIMHHVMIRGDVSAIRIGRRVNVQDGTIIHTQTGVPLHIEDEVSIGHRAVVHCRRVGREALIGTGAVVLDGCDVGEGCIIGACALVTPGTTIPARTVWMGVPARQIREVSPSEREYVRQVVQTYFRLGRLHGSGAYPPAACGLHE
ncbi:MAG: gamma carbonic anhydrase family protein [Phycisphaerae bacterium]|nr:MAG: gamma carbonic anhydrase family protein [Planctomycetota bacterium]KAB2948649.1 MAG: gamma carbonic anhydrase family protein [Phycisphaerae bacterium]MBE7457766.1 gamma carbonic anhydrase family protein [Planctomycetia bacterium]MCK6463715.1 gamma carbonic anhydrase family protein [Phycisphaerae bacterium]MCL4717570.1 gamma carbonic anhydrase family protein [Phycisphaerae bacterium]